MFVVWAALYGSDVLALQCEAEPGDQGNVTDGGNMDKNGHIRYYQPTASRASGSTTITVSSGTGLSAGDMILVIQMQGADINSGNNTNYADGGGLPAAGYNGSNFTAGYYEYAAVQSRSGGTITLASPLVHSYYQQDYGTQGQRRYQVIRVPQYEDLTLSSDITAKAWDGNTGGVLPVDVSDTLNFNGRVFDMSAKGFRGGGGLNHTGRSGWANSDYRRDSSNAAGSAHGSKGEGFAGTPRYVWNGSSNNRTDTGVEGYPNGSYAMGAPGNAGGGGTDGNPAANDQNSGGGGGGNGGSGGRGGNSWSTNLPTGGYGGVAFPAAANRIVMGGGGGAGTMNNSTATPYGGPHGGVGGGIVLIRAGHITGTGGVNVNGGNGVTPLNDGGGGGGAGGSVIVLANSQSGSLTINARGGIGGDSNHNDSHGPGGGGGGGVVFTNSAVSATVDTSQGASGQTGSPREYFGASPSGGVSGNSIPNTPPSSIDGVSPGADCQEYESDLSIEKLRNSGSMQAGGTVQFLIRVQNNGPDATTVAVPILVTDVLDGRFDYTGFTGTGWSCTESPAQTVTCTHNGPLANAAFLPDLFINADIAAAPTSQSVSNTASVALESGHNYSDPNSANNSSTINDVIYGASESGNKWLYTYPTPGAPSTAGTLSRTVPASNIQASIRRSQTMILPLDPVLSGNLVVNGNVTVRLCMKPSSTANQDQRRIDVGLYRGATQIGSTATQYFSNHNWQLYIFSIPHTGPTTVNSGQALSLRVANNGSSVTTHDVDINTNGADTLCPGEGASRAEVNTSTVINVDSVSVYNAAYPAGTPVTRLVQGTTVYVRSTVSDPFGHADINNNSVVHIMDGISVASGPHAQTSVISQSGNTKQFEYQITLPVAPAIGTYDARVTANEGTEGVIAHIAATAVELTSQPALMVTKLSSATTASPGDEIGYTVTVSNNHILSTGDAHNVVISDKLPPFTSFKLNAPNPVVFTDAPSPYLSSALTMGVIEYSDDNAATWTYVPVSGGGGAPAGFDKNVTHFRIGFSGVMPPNGGFQLNYAVRLD